METHPRPVKQNPSRFWLKRRCQHAEPAQVDQHPGLEQVFRRHRQPSLTPIAPCEERGNAVREGPEVKAHHQRGRPFLWWQSSAERLRRLAQHGKAALCELAQTRIAVERKPCFEHRRIVGGFVACKGEICPTDILEGREGIWPAVAPGVLETSREQ